MRAWRNTYILNSINQKLPLTVRSNIYNLLHTCCFCYFAQTNKRLKMDISNFKNRR